MITINSLSIENFRNYKEVNITLDEKTGVYFVFGDNGAGKTTILNAINWCLYGDIAFYGVDKNDRIRPNWAKESDITKVSMVVRFKDAKYGLSRSAGLNDERGNLLVRQISNETGNSSELDSVSAAAIVEQMLPKNIKSLFFLSENFSNEIFSFTGTNSLKSNVEKVSEIDTIDNAIRHLNIAERNCASKIDKNDKDFAEIQKLTQGIAEYKAARDNLQEFMNNKCEEKILEHEEKFKKLKKSIQDHEQCREILEEKDTILKEKKRLQDERETTELDMQSIFQRDYYKLLLEKYVDEYVRELNAASDRGILPAPVNAGLMKKILDTGICLCGRPISDAEREHLQKLKEEYDKRNELKFLTDGINKFTDLDASLIDDFYEYKDGFDFADRVHKLIELKNVALEKIDEKLSGVDMVGLIENPAEALRHEDMKIIKWKDRKVEAAKEKIKTEDAIRRDTAKLNAILAKGGGRDRRELLRERELIEELGEQLQELKRNTEECIKRKIELGAWDIFSRILPDTQFSEIKIGDGYRFRLKSKYDESYADANDLSVGEAKTLALALVSTLSKDIGYSDAPLFIDNLFNGIDETHFMELTRCIESLSRMKQIYITYLYSDNETNNMRVSRYFNREVINKQLNAEKDNDSGICYIKEVSDGSEN